MVDFLFWLGLRSVKVYFLLEFYVEGFFELVFGVGGGVMEEFMEFDADGVGGGAFARCG